MHVKILSYGCTANQNDSEIMAGLLAKAGAVIVDKGEDITIVNTCIVKGQTERQMKKILRDLSGFVIVSGCMPEAELDEIEKIIPEASIVSTHHIARIVEAVQKTLMGERVVYTGPGGKEKIGLSKIPANPAVNTIQINEGCVGSCAYCIVKKVKPVLRSYSESMILKSAGNGLKNGAKEIWLTSQDTAAYGIERSGKSELPLLLRALCELSGKFMIRVGMMNPDNVLPVLDEMIEAFDSPKIFKFIHIPVQAGSDRVLKAMHRKYTAEEFARIVSAFRGRFPDMVVATDVICGFPEETDEEFDETVELVEQNALDIVNISRYTMRPGTEAEGMKEHPSRITKDRSRLLAERYSRMAAERNKRFVGLRTEVLFDANGKDLTTLGRDGNYRQVAVEGKHRIGTRAKVEITDSNAYHLKGKII